MRIPYNWLKEYIDFELSPEQVAESLTMRGIEVSSIIYARPDIENVVVGEILKVKPVPGTDKLLLCQVSDGRQIFSVVCGAKNIKERDKVPLARVGARLPGGIRISKKKIAEQLSNGMLCSEKELGMGEDSSGILVLDRNAKLGEKLEKVMLTNPVLDIELTANRSDCASMVGIARELAGAVKKPVKLPSIEVAEEGAASEDLVKIEITDTERCRRYAARIIQEVTVSDSPSWLANRIRELGFRPVNNVVDVTNYVLAELGHPLHAFDYDKLSNHRIIVRCAGEQETLRCLDNLERKLTNDDLVIADDRSPVALAGIIGGEAAGVTSSTKNVLLESAYFTYPGIRRTAKRLNVSTESSYRFERGVDVENVLSAINRAAQLILKLSGGKIAKGIIDIYPHPLPVVKIDFSLRKAREIIGSDISDDRMTEILGLLGFACSMSPDNMLHVTVPSYRNDIMRECDLMEEIARISGYDSIPSTTPKIRVSEYEDDKLLCAEERVKDVMTRLGFFEVVNHSLLNPEVCGEETVKGVCISNPLLKEQSFMRTSLLEGLFSTVRRNLNHGNKDLKIFELGRIFTKTDTGISERRRIAGCLMGRAECDYWNEKPSTLDFYYLKGILMSFLAELGIDDVKVQMSTSNLFHPARSAMVMVKNDHLGDFGELSPTYLRKYEFETDVYVFDIDFDMLSARMEHGIQYAALPKYPAITRDIALISARHLSYSAILDRIKRSGGILLENASLFDLYEGEQIKEGHRSLAFRLIYRSPDRTLTDREINDLHAKVIADLEKELKVEIRK